MSLPVIERVNVITPAYDNSIMEDLFPYEEPTDANTKTHYVNPPMNLHIWRDGMTTQELVDIARATGQEIVALCGYRWVPKHDPDKLDVCEQCVKIAAQMMAEDDE